MEPQTGSFGSAGESPQYQSKGIHNMCDARAQCTPGLESRLPYLPCCSFASSLLYHLHTNGHLHHQACVVAGLL